MTADELGFLYGSNIRRLRIEKKFSQERLSELADISSGFLSEIESGKKMGTFETIAKIVNALQVEPFELFLPPNMGVNYDSRRTKQLMAQLRSAFSSLADTLEGFLAEK